MVALPCRQTEQTLSPWALLCATLQLYFWIGNVFARYLFYIVLPSACKNDLSKYRYTIDNINDFKVFEEILKVFKYDEVIKLKYYQIANFLKKNKKLILYQKKLQRNYGWKSSIEKDIKYLRTNS